MKKFLLTVAMATCTLFAMAQKNYTDDLVVTIDGASSPVQSSIIEVVDNGDNTCTLTLKDFFLKSGGIEMPIGTIVLTNIPVQATEKGYSTIETNQNIVIQQGSYVHDWVGPMLGEIPVDLKGKMSAEKLYCTIDIDMSGSLGQIIEVVFGSDFVETSINGVEAENGAVVVYDLLGRRVKDVVTPGVYIVNGKKMIVK
ncbi:MAG: calycin-like domain-containing protein [Bacteroidaceae bacterium]|nr:calycin-like domain-containing protein [Bacteroidaceae bacterium]